MRAAGISENACMHAHQCVFRWIPLVEKQGAEDMVMKRSIPAVRLNIREEKGRNTTRLLQELQPPRGVERIFCCAKMLQTPLAGVWYHFTTELWLGSSRFHMCERKFACVHVTSGGMPAQKKGPTKRKHGQLMVWSQLERHLCYLCVSFCHVWANLLRSWKCPGPGHLLFRSGSPGTWPAPIPAPLLYWQTTNLERERRTDILLLTIIKAWRMAASVISL